MISTLLLHCLLTFFKAHLLVSVGIVPRDNKALLSQCSLSRGSANLSECIAVLATFF